MEGSVGEEQTRSFKSPSAAARRLPSTAYICTYLMVAKLIKTGDRVDWRSGLRRERDKRLAAVKERNG